MRRCLFAFYSRSHYLRYRALGCVTRRFVYNVQSASIKNHMLLPLNLPYQHTPISCFFEMFFT